MTSQIKELIFIYNADNTVFSKMTDFAHKIISPKTYQCNLCKLTYGNFSMHKEWEEFLKGLDINIEFTYKDEFIKNNPEFLKQEFPLVLSKGSDAKVNILINSSELNKQKSLSDLKALLLAKLS